MKTRIIIFLLFPFLGLFANESRILLDSVSAQPVFYKTMGLYSDITPFAAGILQQVNFQFTPWEELRFSTKIGATYNPVDDSNYELLVDTILAVSGGRRFALNDRFTLTPQLAVGVIMHNLMGDLDDSGESSYSLFADQYYALSLEMEVSFPHEEDNGYWSFIMAPEGAIFPELDEIGILAGVSLGLKRNL
jgi:hypothetical protein